MDRKNIVRIGFALILFLLHCNEVSAANKEGLQILDRKIRSFIGSKKAVMDIGFSFLDIRRGYSLSVNGEAPYPLASVFKIPILIAVMKKVDSGGLSLSTMLTIREMDRCIGSGSMKNLPPGTKVTVKKCIEEMITVSDNTATDLLWNMLGNGAVNAMLQELNLAHSSVYIPNRPGYLISLGQGSEFKGKRARQIAALWRKKTPPERLTSMERVIKECSTLGMTEFEGLENASAAEQTRTSYYDDVEVADALDNYSSPLDMASLLAGLTRGELLSTASTRYCLDVMARTHYNTRIPRDLPRNIPISHKTGTICGIVNDAGIIEIEPQHHVVVIAFVKNIAKSRQREAGSAIATLARHVYDFCEKQ
jgi:beta-lactamase class A